MNEPRYSAGVVCKHLGITRRQLQYWVETGITGLAAKTATGYQRFEFRQIVLLKVVQMLRHAGVPLQVLRRSVSELKTAIALNHRELLDMVFIMTSNGVVSLLLGGSFKILSGGNQILSVIDFRREVLKWRRADRGK